MSRVCIFSFTVLVALSFMTGCAQEQQVQLAERICLPQVNKDEAMRAAENVLGRMYFVLDKADSEQGYIRTQPLPAGQFFEFWRKDNVGSFNFAEANLHSIRRTVELNITEAAEQEKLCISCIVNAQRLSMPDGQVGTSGLEYQRLRFKSPGATWVDLGRDGRLETEILRRIKEEFTKSQKEKTG